jgi:hypothetical protein
MKKRSKILIYPLVITGFILMLTYSCKKDEKKTDPTPTPAPTVVATEEWGVVMNNDTTNNGQHTLTKKSDGTITTSGSWTFQGTTCPFQNAAVTVTDTIFSFTATGIATNPAAPVGYNTSPFTLHVDGITHNGVAQDVWTIGFTTFGWPTGLNGTAVGTRTSGSGITN